MSMTGPSRNYPAGKKELTQFHSPKREFRPPRRLSSGSRMLPSKAPPPPPPTFGRECGKIFQILLAI